MIQNNNSKLSKKSFKDEIPELLSISQASKYSGLGRNNIAYLIKNSFLPIVKLPGYNRIKIHRDDIINLINSSKLIHR